MPLNELERRLARIVALAQAEVRCPCPCHNQGLRGHYHTGEPPCPTCHGSGRVPDPRFKGLVEALSNQCAFCKGVRPHECGYCDGSGRVLIDWGNLPQGALAGTLLHWADMNIHYDPALSSPQLHTLLVLCFREPDVDDKASEVFLKFMQRKKEV